MYNICFYFFMFYFYSIFGWLVECIKCSIDEKRFVHDRGFLLGTYCPIYGIGAMYMYFFLNRYYNEPITLFVMAVVGTSILEYVTSYLMEKIFNARWWDYSDRRYNLEGRICLENAIGFGILGIAFVYLINPAFIFIIRKIPKIILIIISLVLFMTFIVDVVLSFVIMIELRKKLTRLKKDSTTDIDQEVRRILSSNAFYFRRLFKAFPKVKFSLPFSDILNESIINALDGMDKLRRERKKKIKELKKELKKRKKNLK